MPANLSIQTSGPAATQLVGRIIGEQAQPGDIYLLTGPLGAGKTCLTQGIAWGLGVAGHPRSPTFVLMTRYQGRLTLHHMDLYRISDPLEAWDLGLDELLGGDGVCVIEWADQAEEIFTEDAVWIELDYGIPGPEQEELVPEDLATSVGGDPSAGNSTGRVEPGEEMSPRTITFARHSPRYDSLLAQIARAFPKTETND